MLHRLYVWLGVWPVCSSVSSHSSIDQAEPAEGCRPRALVSALQRLFMEDVNICSGASRGSPSRSRDCSQHINISEAKGTSGHAVPVCVRNRGGERTTVCAVTEHIHTHSYTQTPPLLQTPPIHSLYLNPLFALFSFFLVAFWPCDCPSVRKDMDMTAGDNNSPLPTKSPPACCLIHPMTLELPLNFCCPMARPSLDTNCLPSNVTYKNTLARLDASSPNLLFLAQDLHLKSGLIPSQCHWLRQLTENLGPVSRHCFCSCSLDVRLAWLAATGLFTLSSANKISPFVASIVSQCR